MPNQNNMYDQELVDSCYSVIIKNLDSLYIGHWKCNNAMVEGDKAKEGDGAGTDETDEGG